MKIKQWLRLGLALLLVGALFSPRLVRAESQGSEYKGITDPFGDPQNYEFAEDEKEDKEWFHLGRFLMLSVQLGYGIFTGGLGSTVNPNFYGGANLVYFFDRSIALDFGGHYANHLDNVISKSGTSRLSIDTNMIPITLGLRYYIDVRSAPKAIAVANPYIAAGGGLYLRTQNVVPGSNVGFSVSGPNGSASGTTNNFGAYAGGGVEFLVYSRHIYLGADLRYNFVFFVDADDDFGGTLPAGSRSGNYFTPTVTFTYNF
jgi:outer membrane protein W